MKTKEVQIDTETNSLIEANRHDFGETENDIIKRCLSVILKKNQEKTEPILKSNPMGGLVRKTYRKSGRYGYRLLGSHERASSLKAAYVSCLRHLQARDPGFFEKLGEKETRARRIVSTDPTRLYKNSPDLAAQHAEKIDGSWFVDVNLSEPQVVQRLKIACEVAGIKFGRELVLEFN